MPLPPDAIAIDSMQQGKLPADAIALDNAPAPLRDEFHDPEGGDIRSKRFIPQFMNEVYKGVPFGKDVVPSAPNGAGITKQDYESTPSPQNFPAWAGKIAGAGAAYLPGFEFGANMFARPALEGATKLATLTGEKALAKNIGKQVATRALAGGSLGVGAQAAGEASSEGGTPAQSIGQGALAAGETFAGGKVLGAAGDAIMNTTQGMRDVSGRIHNWIVKNPTRAFNYGKDPLAVMQKEGITANTITDYVQKAGQRLDQRSTELNDAIAGSDKTVDVSDIIDNHLTDARSKLTGSLKDRSASLEELDTLKTNLEDKYGDLSSLPVQKAVQLKRQLADDFPFTNETKTDPNTIAAHKIYHSINEAVDVAHPEIADLNEKVSSLIDIKRAATNRMAVDARNNPFGLISSILAIGTGAHFGGFEGGAAGIGTILAAKVATSPAVLTRVANALSVMANVDKINLFKVAPWFKSIAQKAEEFKANKLEAKTEITGGTDNPISSSFNPLNKQGVPGSLAEKLKSEKGSVDIGDSLSPLHAEALKYETPEEFVKNQPIIYHGTDKIFNNFDIKKSADGTIWFTDNKSKITAGEVSATGKGQVIERFINENKLKFGGWDESDKYSTDELIAKGYDGLKLPDGEETTYQIFNPNKLYTKSQLIDIWNEAHSKRGKNFDESQIKSMIEKAGGKFKQITDMNNSLYDNEPTIYFDDAKGSTKTIRPSQLNDENIKAKMEGKKISGNSGAGTLGLNLLASGAIGLGALAGNAQAATPVKAGQELQGKASTYGWGEKLNPFTFSGERFKPEGVTVAMRGVPMGTKVEVTDPRTNKKIEATVNDGGPAKRLNRVVDLSRGAWKELGYGKPGLVNVKVKILELGKGKSYNGKR